MFPEMSYLSAVINLAESEGLICTYFSSKDSENGQLLPQHEKEHRGTEQLIEKNETSLPKMRTLGDHSCSDKESKRGRQGKLTSAMRGTE